VERRSARNRSTSGDVSIGSAAPNGGSGGNAELKVLVTFRDEI
jgi:hypothetical protein